jgi:putative addiction module component (TIGR02574 family)
LLEELRSLPVEEREAVVAELYEGTSSDDEEWAPAYLAELERRVHAARSGLSPSISHEQLRAEVQEALRSLPK